MSEQNVKWYNHGWMYVIGGALLAPVGTLLFDWIRELPVLTTLTLFVNKFLAIANLSVPLYLLIISVVIFNIVWRFLLEIENRKIVGETQRGYLNANHLDTLNYIADRFHQLTFKWDWILNKLTKKYEVKNVKAVCNKVSCDYNELSYIRFDAEFGRYIYHCDKCNTFLMDSYSTADVANEVEAKFEQ